MHSRSKVVSLVRLSPAGNPRNAHSPMEIDAPESSQLCRGDDALQYRCGAKAANDLDAFIASRPVSCIPISLARYRRVWSAAWILANGSFATVSRWIGHNIRRENSNRSSVKLCTPDAACGRAATSSHGYIGFVFGPTEARALLGRREHPSVAPRDRARCHS
jgi:hypothetical protein